MVMMVIGSCSFAGGYIYCNEHNFHPVETSLMRGLAVSVLSFALIRWLRLDFCFPSAHNLRWLLIRNGIMVVHNFAYNLAQFYLPLPIAITLGYISPIFIYFYDYWLYGITINRGQIVFLIISIIGVVLTANSSFLITFFDDIDFDRSKFEHYQTRDPFVMTVASLILVVVMTGHAYGVVLTKKLIGVHSAQINYVQGALIFYAAAILFPAVESDHAFGHMDFSTFVVALLVSGVPMAVGQLCYIGALMMTKNMGLITTLSFSSIILGNLISILRYDEKVNFIGTLGSVCIIVGIVFIIRLKDTSSIAK